MNKGSNKREQASPDSAGSERDHVESQRSNDMKSETPAFDEEMPQTCCSNCNTLFEVSPDVLASSDTRVRCGECLSIFDALTNLVHTADPEEEVWQDENDDSIASKNFSEQRAPDEFETSEPVSDVPSVATDADPAIVVDADSELSAQDNDGAEDRESAREAHQPEQETAHRSAREVKADEKPEARDPVPAQEHTRTNDELFSEDAALPNVAYLDQTRDMGNLNFDEPDGDETFNDEVFAHDLTAGPNAPIDSIDAGDSTIDTMALDSNVDIVSDDERSEPVVFNYQDHTPERPDDSDAGMFPGRTDIHAPVGGSVTPNVKSSPITGKWALRGILALLMLVIAGGLYGYRNRHAIVQNPDLRPFLSTACWVIRCELPPLVKLDALKVLKRSVFSHPTLENSLVIDLAFVNDADFKQAYPVLEVRLTNLIGGLVSQQDIAPADYAGKWQPGDLLNAGQRIDLNLTVEDPGQTATSFELKFR